MLLPIALLEGGSGKQLVKSIGHWSAETHLDDRVRQAPIHSPLASSKAASHAPRLACVAACKHVIASRLIGADSRSVT